MSSIVDKFKKEMIKHLEELYKHPSEIKYPAFELQVIKRYDAEAGEMATFTRTAIDNSLFAEEFFNDLHGGLGTLMMALVSHVDKDGFCFPSIDKLIKETGLSKRTIIRYLEDYANVQIKGRVLLYKMSFKRGKNHTKTLYYIPNCRVFFDSENDISTDEDKSNDVSIMSKKVFDAPEIVLDDEEDFAEEDNKPEGV